MTHVAAPGRRLLVRGAGQLLTMASPGGPKRGAALRSPGIVAGGCVGAVDGRIVAVGCHDDVVRALGDGEVTLVEADGGLLMPGFVDPHSHIIWVGPRALEFEARQLTGATFVDSVNAGGGSMSTIRLTRAASDETLAELIRTRLRRMLEHGTTTAEVKSGYGLTVAEELRHLEILADVARTAGPRVVATALPAHFRPPEHKEDPEPYLDEICDVFLPEVARRRLATSVDIFCEPGIYTPEQARRVLMRARELDLGIRLHADQLSHSGGTRLGAELGALSVDHAGFATTEDLAALAASPTIAVIIPGSYFLGPGEPMPPARAMIEAGVAVALSTDYNPGTSPIVSQALTVSLACVLLHLDAAEALSMATINAAHGVGLGDEVGSLEAGKRADLVVLEADDYRDIPYRFGENLVRTVVVDGVVQVRRPPVGPL